MSSSSKSVVVLKDQQVNGDNSDAESVVSVNDLPLAQRLNSESEEEIEAGDKDSEILDLATLGTEVWIVILQVIKWILRDPHTKLLAEWVESEDSLPSPIPRAIKKLWPIMEAILVELEFQMPDQSSEQVLRKFVAGALQNTDITLQVFGCCKTWGQLKTYLANCSKQAARSSGSGLSSRKTMCTSSMTAHFPTEPAGVSSLALLEGSLVQYASRNLAKRQETQLSSITSRRDKKILSSEKFLCSASPTLKLELHLTDLTRVPQAELESSEMWKWRNHSVTLYLDTNVNQQDSIGKMAHRLIMTSLKLEESLREEEVLELSPRSYPIPSSSKRSRNVDTEHRSKIMKKK